MIPLYFNKNNIPDVALVLNEIDGKCYQARTCLSMKMAYIDARIILSLMCSGYPLIQLMQEKEE